MIDMGKIITSYRNSLEGLEPILGSLRYRPIMLQEYNNTTTCMCRSPEAIKYIAGVNNPSDLPDGLFNELQKINGVASKAYNLNYSRLISMFESYQKALMKRGVYPDPKDYKDYSTIDATKIIAIKHPVKSYEVHESIALYNEIIEFGNNTKFYGIIPCFKRGVLKLTRTSYVSWDLMNLDLDNTEMTISCYTWIPRDTVGLSFDIPYAKFTFTVHYNDIGSGLINSVIFKDIKCLSMLETFQAISPKQMKWTKDDRLVWNRVYVRFAKLVDQISTSPAPYGAVCDMMNDIIFGFLGTNYFLHKNRQNISLRPKDSDPIVLTVFNQDAQDKRRLIDVTMYVTSNNDIQQIKRSRDTICYQVASWNCRGYIRRYKDGKMVYVKPHVRHRRCMGEFTGTVKPAPQSIDIHDGVSLGV